MSDTKTTITAEPLFGGLFWYGEASYLHKGTYGNYQKRKAAFGRSAETATQRVKKKLCKERERALKRIANKEAYKASLIKTDFDVDKDCPNEL